MARLQMCCLSRLLIHPSSIHLFLPPLCPLLSWVADCFRLRNHSSSSLAIAFSLTHSCPIAYCRSPPQARVALERKQFQSAESLFLKAKRPELALKMFRDQRMFHDALRIAEDYLPGKVAEIQVRLVRLSGTHFEGGWGCRRGSPCFTTCCALRKSTYPARLQRSR